MLEFLVNCYSEEKPSVRSRTNALLVFCKSMNIRVSPGKAENDGECVCYVVGTNYEIALKTSALMSFCSLHRYPILKLPDTPLEEYMQKL